MRSCAVIFIWRGVIRSEHETSILHTCRVYCELSISLFVEVGNKDSFVYYRKVICIMVFAYFIHEDTILPCAPFFMKGRSSHMYGRRGGKKSHFQFVSVRATHIKQFGSEHNKARAREGWQFDVTSLIFVPLASIVLPCIQCCITTESVLGSISRKLHRKKETKGGCPRS